MAFTQNLAADRRRRIHARAHGHGRRVCPRRVAVELPSPSSSCERTESDPAADRQHHTIAESHDGRCGRGFRYGRPSADGLGTS